MKYLPHNGLPRLLNVKVEFEVRQTVQDELRYCSVVSSSLLIERMLELSCVQGGMSDRYVKGRTIAGPRSGSTMAKNRN